MTWNFPEDQIGKLEAMAAYLNFLKTEVEQLRKNFPIVPEAVLGTFGGGPTDVIIGGGGGGTQEKCFAVGKTVSSSDKSSTAMISVTLYSWNGSSHVSGSSLSAFNLFGSIGSGKFVALAKDIDTDAWYITAAECG